MLFLVYIRNHQNNTAIYRKFRHIEASLLGSRWIRASLGGQSGATRRRRQPACR